MKTVMLSLHNGQELLSTIYIKQFDQMRVFQKGLF